MSVPDWALRCGERQNSAYFGGITVVSSGKRNIPACVPDREQRPDMTSYRRSVLIGGAPPGRASAMRRTRNRRNGDGEDVCSSPSRCSRPPRAAPGCHSGTVSRGIGRNISGSSSGVSAVGPKIQSTNA